MYTKLYSARSSYNTPWELFVFEPLSFRFFDLRYSIRVVSRAITLGFYHVILMHGGICEHGLYMLTFSALCEYFDADTSRCVVCWVSLTIQEVVETARCTVDVFWPF